MHIWIVGGGSIGMLLAAKLRMSGNEVLLITRTESQAALIREQGIGMLAEDAEHSIFLFCASFAANSASVAEPPFKDLPPDWIIVATKQNGLTGQLLRWLGRASETYGDTNVLAIQNGYGHMQRLSGYVQEKRLFVAVTAEGANRKDAMHVEHTGTGLTQIATYSGLLDENLTFQLKRLQNVLNDAGFHTVLSNNLGSMVWDKLIINSVINPLTAIMGIRNGELLHSASLRHLMRRLFEEAVQVAEQCGIQTDGLLWEKMLHVCERTSVNQSSMLQDILQNRPTEIDWLNGAIVRTAQQWGSSVPTHEMIVQLVKAREEIR